ncbi:MAG TPA: subclass B3 metallo-beta-lactamase [Tepidisphaeraceae bacterium]|nr:subclass B3 metallo-beta-lactamase [Tepidisphaeraceae bacterium]
MKDVAGRVPVVLGCVIVLVAGLARAQTPPDAAALAKDPPLFLRLASQTLKWNEPAEPCHLVGPIYFVGTKGLSSFLITTPQGHILLNTGMGASGPMIVDSIRKLGFKPEDIKLLLGGHAHVDHVGAVAYLKKLSGAQIAMIEQEVPLFESGGKLDFHYGAYPVFAFEPAKVDRVLHDGETIKLGDVEMKVLLTPGHTKGSMTFTMNVVDGGKTYAVVFPNGTSINPGYRVAVNPSYPGIEDDYRRSLKILEDLKPDIWLDSHTEFFAFEEKRARVATEGTIAWVDPEGYRKKLADARAKLEATIKTEKEIAAGRTELLGADAGGAVNVHNFIRAETDFYFAKTARDDGAFGKLRHRREMASIDKQDVVRMNRDTLYSSGVFDLDAAPLAITLPDSGGRFMSMQVISQDHYTTEVAYAPGTFNYTRDKVGTRYVYIIVRTLANPEDAQDMKAANAVQDAIKVQQASVGTFEVPKWDESSQNKVRDALAVLVSLGNIVNRFGTKQEVDPIDHLIGTAIGWGGNPRSAADYVSFYPKDNDGKVAYTLAVKDVPVDGFWSITVYNDKGFMQKNDLRRYSLNNLTAKPGPDGSFTIHFGGDQNAANYLPIMPGWNYTVRLYRPRKEILDGTWRFPDPQPAK